MVKPIEDKWELHITETVKIQQFDDRNFLILELKEAYSPFTKSTAFVWKERGFYSTIRKALFAIVERDMLVDVETIKTLTGYLKAVKKQSEIVRNLFENDSITEIADGIE